MSQRRESSPDLAFKMAQTSKDIDKEADEAKNTIEGPLQNDSPLDVPVNIELQISVKKGMFCTKF
jgi:hypothetical protein